MMGRIAIAGGGRLARYRRALLGAALALAFGLTAASPGARGGEDEEIATALSLAKLLQAGRAVISSNQGLINDPARGDKGLTADVVIAATIESYRKATGSDPLATDAQSRLGRLLRAELASIREVMDDNQALINQPGTGFKGFIPAVFGRLVTERMRSKVADEAIVKITAPPELVRNRRSRPDEWESTVIATKFLAAGWPTGQIFAASAPSGGRDAFRVMVPEYYKASCLSCHGTPKGALDITGYPKEGAHEGDLGGIISISLFGPRSGS
jgi:hypothetical protein